MGIMGHMDKCEIPQSPASNPLGKRVLAGCDAWAMAIRAAAKCPNGTYDCEKCPGSPTPGALLCKIGTRWVADIKTARAAGLDC